MYTRVSKYSNKDNTYLYIVNRTKLNSIISNKILLILVKPQIVRTGNFINANSFFLLRDYVGKSQSKHIKYNVL